MDEAERRATRVRGALHDEVARVGELLRSIHAERTGGEAGGADRAGRLGSWDGGDVAMHLSQSWLALPALARGDVAAVEAQVPVAADLGGALIGEFGELGAFTEAAVRSDDERDLAVLAERIETRAAEYLGGTTTGDAQERRPWLVAGVSVPVALFAAHVLTETVVHGADIARAAGRPWRIDPLHAALVVDEFLMVVLAEATGIVPGRRPPDPRVAGLCELRVRGGRRHRIRIADGTASPDHGTARPDCVLSLDPVALLLVFFGRRSPAAAVLSGGMAVWGRRPWLGLALLGTLPAP